jgi:hypothetical protein
VVGKDPVELEKYEKKFALPEEDVSTLILFNTYLCGSGVPISF